MTPIGHSEPVHMSLIIGLVVAGVLLVFFLSLVAMTPNGGLDAPEWNPEGTQSFREWYTELMAWLAVTGPKYPPQAQAGAIQLAMKGTARKLVFNIAPQYIQFGAVINGVRTDPVT